MTTDGAKENARTTHCPNCSCEFKNISQHWARSKSCDYPEFPNAIKQILGGVYSVSGALLESSPGKTQMKLTKYDNEPLKPIRSALGIFSNDVHGYDHKSEFGNDVVRYELYTIPHPAISDEFLRGVEPTRIFYKAATTLSGGYNGVGSYSIDLQPIPEWDARKKFEPVASSINVNTRDRGKKFDGESQEYMRIWIPKDTMERIEATKWPNGWWNREKAVR